MRAKNLKAGSSIDSCKMTNKLAPEIVVGLTNNHSHGLNQIIGRPVGQL